MLCRAAPNQRISSDCKEGMAPRLNCKSAECNAIQSHGEVEVSDCYKVSASLFQIGSAANCQKGAKLTAKTVKKANQLFFLPLALDLG